MRALRIPAVAGCLIALALAGCGESSATDRGGLLTVRVGEYEITPESVQMPAGSVRISARNDGVLVHEVAVANADGVILKQTGAIFPGRTVTTTPFTIAPGSYRVYDPGANYADLGAYGSLHVVGR